MDTNTPLARTRSARETKTRLLVRELKYRIGDGTMEKTDNRVVEIIKTLGGQDTEYFFLQRNVFCTDGPDDT